MAIQIHTMEEAALLYRRIEASLEEKKQVFEEACAKEKRALEQLTVIMRAMLNQAGVGSMNIPNVAEVKLQDKRTFGCADWDRFYPWMIDNDVPELLQKKIHESNMQFWIDEQEKRKLQDPEYTYELPPGITVYTEKILKVLKGK